MIEVKIDLRQVTATLDQLQRRLGNASELMSGAAMLLESMTQQAFIDQGPGWQDLAASTKAKREKKGTWPGRILDVSTAGLKASVMSDSGNDWAHVGAGSGKSMVYAMIHQFGGQAGRGKKTTIPARPYLPLTSDGKGITSAAEKSLTELTLDCLNG